MKEIGGFALFIAVMLGIFLTFMLGAATAPAAA